MKKTLQQVIAAFVLPALVAAGVMCPSRAWAVDTAEVVSVAPSAPVQVAQDDAASALSNEELLAGYIEQQFAAQLPAQDDGEPVLSAQSVGESLTGNTAIAYEYVKAEVAKIAAGESGHTSTVIAVDLDTLADKVGQRWTAADLGVTALVENGHYTDEAWQAIQERILEVDFGALVSALQMDCPYEMYWFDKTKGYLTTPSLNYYGDSVALKSTTFSVSFTVAEAYVAGEYEVNTPVADRVTNAVANAAGIVADNASASSYEKLVAYKEAICGLVEYNDAAAQNVSTPYGDPWQLVYVFDGDTSTDVVCEGYAKAFKYLCDLSNMHGVECLLVSGLMDGGTGAGSHMWNVVKMYDGKSYLVDVTNCDEDSVGFPDELFMRHPTSGSAREGYTYVIDELNQVTYTYYDSTSGRTDMWSLYSDDELTLASTDFDPATIVDPSVEDLSAALVVAEDMTYTGSALTPEPTVTLGDKTLTAGTDYTVAYENNVNAGEATVAVTGTGGYMGTATGTFTINPKAVTPTVTLSTNAVTYTGHEHRPSVSRVTADGKQFSSKYYDMTYPESCVNAGTYEVTVTLKGNYTGTGTATFTIRQAAMSSTTVELEQGPFVYNGAEHRPAFTVYYAGEAVSPSNYTVTYSNNVNAETATLRLIGRRNFNGPKNVTFTIEPRELEDEMVSLAESPLVYDGSAKEPAVTVIANGATLAAGTDYAVAYDSASNVNAGISTVVVTGKGNYAGKATATFEIKPRSIEDAGALALADPAELVYSPDSQEPQVRVTLDNGATELLAGTDYKLYYEDDALDAGAHEVTVTGTGNYTGKLSAPYEVTQADQAINIVNSEVLGMVYGQTANLEVEAQGELTFESSDEAVFTVDAAGKLVATGIGQAKLIVAATSTRNYKQAELRADVQVDYADLSEAAVSFAAPSFAYTGGPIEPAVTVKVVGRTLVEGTDYTVAYDSASNVNVGTSTVTVTGMGNYTGEATATFAIAKARPVISAADKKVVATKTVRLGATVRSGAGALTYKSLSAKVATVSETGVVRGVAAGTAKVTVSCAGDDNHEAASKTVTITVSRASSTLKASAKKKSVTASLAKVAKANLKLAPNLAVSVAKGQQVTYASASTKAVASKFKVNAKNGRVTVAKGTKKGTYTVKVKVTAKQSAVYKAATKTVSYKVVVK